MAEFQDIQMSSRDKSQEFIHKAQNLKHSGEFSPKKEEDERSQLLNSENKARGPTEQSLATEISYNEDLILEREQGIQEIEAAMAEVHEIFCDLGLIVGEQQGLVHNIEANMEASAVRTRAAVRELSTARDRQRRRRGNVICVVLLAIFIFIMSLALINAIF